MIRRRFSLYRLNPEFLVRGVLLPTVCLLLPVFADAGPYVLEIKKSSQQLLVKRGDDVIKSFRIASGKGGSGTKDRAGDNKTPVGIYKIIDFNADSRFHFFMLLNYPNTADAWRGYRNNLITGREFRDIVIADRAERVPPQDTLLGGQIGLHGIGEITDRKLSIHEHQNWTEGCIALTNEEIHELRKYTTVGTTVLITE